jgi:replicative DNA helicase
MTQPDLAFPYDDHAERALLGCILLASSDCWDVAADHLRASDFYASRNAAVWRAMAALAQTGSAIDTTLVRGQLSQSGQLEKAGGDEYLLSLTDTLPTVSAAEDYAKRIQKLSTVREVMRAALRLAVEGSKPIEDIDDYFDRASTALGRICERGTDTLVAESMRTILDRSIVELERRQKMGGGLLGHATGITSLDNVIGGFCPGDLIIVGARPAMGKTAFANKLKLGLAVSTRRPVVAFELEMTKEQFGHRTLSSESNVPLSRIRFAKFDSYELETIKHTGTKLAPVPVFICEKRAMRVSEMNAVLRKIQREHGSVAAVTVDYLQLAHGDNHTQQREQEVAEVSRALKTMAGEFRCPVIALSQLNRGLENRPADERRPRMSDLRESGAIEQDADIIFGLYRDEVYNRNTDHPGIAEVIILKQRSGALGTVRLRWAKEFARFDDMNQGEQEDLGL